MAYGIRKGLEDVAYELKGIRNILASLWTLQEGANEKGSSNPEMYADEYISTEECARRLSISDQTIRNWIALGKGNKTGKGWIEGIHYVNINPSAEKKNRLRIPWNQLVRSFAQNPELRTKDYKVQDSHSYRTNKHSIDAYLASLEETPDAENDNPPGASV
jgi:hypothetical protein